MYQYLFIHDSHEFQNQFNFTSSLSKMIVYNTYKRWKIQKKDSIRGDFSLSFSALIMMVSAVPSAMTLLFQIPNHSYILKFSVFNWFEWEKAFIIRKEICVLSMRSVIAKKYSSPNLEFLSHFRFEIISKAISNKWYHISKDV